MLFDEKMARIPQPRRADLWGEYRILCTALALELRATRQQREITADEIAPLKEAAEKANGILKEFEISPSFFPEEADFLPRLTEELRQIMAKPRRED